MPFSIALISESGMGIDIGGYGTRPKTDFWEVVLGTKDIRRASAALGKSQTGNRLRKKLSAYVGLEIARNFAEGKDSNGVKWEPLSQATIKNKTKIGASANRVVIRKPDPKLGFQYGGTKERKRLDNIKGLANFQMGNDTGSKLVFPLVETGDLFKSVTTAVTRTEGDAKSASQIKGGSSIGLVVSERHNVVSFQPSPMGKKWDTKFAVHNKPAGETTQTGKVEVPGREFFYVSEDVLKYTAILIGMARFIGKDVAKPGDLFAETTVDLNKDRKVMTHGQRGAGATIEKEISKSGGGLKPTPFATKQRDGSPRTISRIKGRGYSPSAASKGGRRRRGTGNIKPTLSDFSHWMSLSPSKIASRLGVSLGDMPEGDLSIEGWIDQQTVAILDDAKILGFMKAVDAVSAAKAVGTKNRRKANTSLNRL